MRRRLDVLLEKTQMKTQHRRPIQSRLCHLEIREELT